MHIGAFLFVLGWTVTFVSLGVEILAMLAMDWYRLRRALPCSPLGLMGLGGTCFYLGVAVVALGKCLGQ